MGETQQEETWGEGMEYVLVWNTEKEGSMKEGGAGWIHASGRKVASTSRPPFPTSVDDVSSAFENNPHCLTPLLLYIIRAYCY